jgi:hypothetical protein
MNYIMGAGTKDVPPGDEGMENKGIAEGVDCEKELFESAPGLVRVSACDRGRRS